MKDKKGFQILALILLTSTLLLAGLSPNITNVKAQSQAIVNFVTPVGGATTPSGNGNSYPDGTAVTLIATPGPDSIFLYWAINSTQSGMSLDNNPATLTVSGGVTYTVAAIFIATQPLPGEADITYNPSTMAGVVVLAGVGGTTSPAPGAYHLTNAASTTLTAKPDSGWTFSHWIISGPTDTTHSGVPFTLTPTDNPYTVSHGYGYTYYYQPVFTPVSSSSSTTPTPTVSEFSSAAIIVLAMALVAVTFGTYTYTKRAKK